MHDFQNLCLRKNCVLLNHKNFKCFDEIKDVINTIRVMQQLRNGRCEKERSKTQRWNWTMRFPHRGDLNGGNKRRLEKSERSGMNAAYIPLWIPHMECLMCIIHSTCEAWTYSAIKFMRFIGGEGKDEQNVVRVLLRRQIVHPCPTLFSRGLQASFVQPGCTTYIFESGGLFCRVAFLFAFTYFNSAWFRCIKLQFQAAFCIRSPSTYDGFYTQAL